MGLPASVKHVHGLIANVTEVLSLQGIYDQIAPKGPAQKKKTAILHKSAIVLLVACWEAYVEDLAEHALTFLITHCQDHNSLPQPVLDRISSKYSGSNIWKLAGNGWKVVLRDNLKELIAKNINSLNTPKCAQVDELFLKSIGLANISQNWHWKGRSVSNCKQSFDELITLRGSIAHRVTASKSVTRIDVLEAKELIQRLAAKSSNAVDAHLFKATGKSPWGGVRYGTTS